MSVSEDADILPSSGHSRLAKEEIRTCRCCPKLRDAESSNEDRGGFFGQSLSFPKFCSKQPFGAMETLRA